MNSYVRKKKFYLCYIITFAIMAFFVLGNYLFLDKSFVRYSDGLNQYFYSLCYYGDYLRDIVKNIVTEGNFTIPMWDMSLGLGSDILTTLHYYVIGDPLNLLSVFIRKEYMLYFFCGLVILRIFLSGLSFSYFCFFHGNKEEPTLFGTLIYCFSGWCLLTGMKYASFVNVMIYFPLLLVGIEKIYRKEKPVLFILMIALSASSNFYFFYMLCIFAFIYAVFRYFYYEPQVSLKSIGWWFFRFVGYFGIGILISSCILLPNINVLLSGKRMSVEYVVPLLYSFSYYLSIPLNLITFWNFGSCGYTPFILPALVIVFRKKNKWPLKIVFVLFIVFMCIPFFGYAINGFSYVSNRWFWALTFLACCIIVKGYPDFFYFTKKECIVIGIIGAFYVPLWCLILEKWYTSLILLILCLILVILCSNCSKARKKDVGVLLLYLGMFLCININSRNIYLDETAAEGIVNNVSLHADDSLYSFAPSASLKKIFEEEPVSRYDQLFPNSLVSINTPMLHNVNGMQFYFSLADGAIEEFFDELYINAPCDFQYAGVDSRTILNSISAVKYCLAEKEGTQPIPWGFEEKELSEDEQYRIYEQKNALPLAFTYSSYVPENVWQKKNVVQKQAVFLESVVLEDSEYAVKEPHYNEVNLEYEISNLDGVTLLGDGKIKTTKDSSLTLAFLGIQKSETYVILENLNFEGEDTSSDIRFLTTNYEKRVRFFTERYDQYSGKHNFLCNMGYSQEPLQEVQIVFDKEGIYSYDDLSIVCQPTENFEESIQILKENTMQNIKKSTNKITGNITLENPQILFFSIPYSKGWSIFVDGKEQELKRANRMFMATELEEGIHRIELHYRTPCITLGIGFSIFGIILLLWVNLYYCKKGRLS